MVSNVFVTENSEKKEGALPKTEFGYKAMKAYTRYFHNKIYYRKTYYLNTENIPEDCPLMIVSNHQNCMCDPLGLLMSLSTRQDTKPKIITRANIFQNPVSNKILRYFGLVPIFRMNYDGIESVSNNQESFNEVEYELANNGTVIIFPEGKHQNKRWLGDFSYGYLRILFETAEKCNFEKELFVLPACNHYSNYFGIQEDMLIKYGNPISIEPYYELYKTKPRTAQRKVNALVRKQMERLMLNIDNLDNYKEIDYLRETYGIKYAKEQGYDPNVLPEKLISDKQFYAKLEELKKTDENAIIDLYDDVKQLIDKEKEFNIQIKNYENSTPKLKTIAEGFLFALFFPLFVFALIPNALITYPPKVINSKIEDKMMHNSVFFIMILIITMPFLYLLFFVIAWIAGGSFFHALIYLIALPFLGIFAWNYNKTWKNWCSRLRFEKKRKAGILNETIELKTKIFETIDELLRK